MTQRQKFIRWYVRPFNRLKRVKNGDAAYVALTIGFSLCERYYRIRSNTITDYRKTVPFLTAAARDFNCDVHLFQVFWSIFRNGIQHQGSPKKKYKANWLPNKPEVRINWAIGSDFSHRPAYIITDHIKRIGVDPWKFTRFVLCKFLSDPRSLERSISHAFGSILTQPQKPPRIIEIPFR
jgi:hypothetical protein